MGKARGALDLGPLQKEFANWLYWVPRDDHRKVNSRGETGKDWDSVPK